MYDLYAAVVFVARCAFLGVDVEVRNRIIKKVLFHSRQMLDIVHNTIILSETLMTVDDIKLPAFGLLCLYCKYLKGHPKKEVLYIFIKGNSK